MADFLTLGNFITWAICAIFIYLSLNFRMYMIFHHPGRKLKAKVQAKRMARADEKDSQPDPQKPLWERDRECLQPPCFARERSFADEGLGK